MTGDWEGAPPHGGASGEEGHDWAGASPPGGGAPPPPPPVTPAPAPAAWAGTEPLAGSFPPPAGAGGMPGTARRLTDEERRVILAQQIQMGVVQGRRVESQSDFQAVLAFGMPVNHTLHAILTIFTCLLWGIVWAIVAGTGGVTRELLVVDDYGNVRLQHLGKT